MEAPEKIYMTPSFGEPDNVLLATFSKSHLNFHQDIEYVRKDAFIEKACKFLKFYRQNMPDSTGYIADIVNDKTIEDFINYIKRE